MNCEQSVQIHRYHDGDLSALERAQVQAHLRSCAECQELLADLENLSHMFATVPLPEMTTRAMNRMEGSFWAAAKQAQDRSVRRFASWLTAAAAAVLLFVPLAPPAEHPTEEAGVWADTLALIPPSEMRDSPSADLVEVSRWMANDVNIE
jgi:anti-sigma factor RsiW